jgi:hypothetical protein
LRDLHVAAHGTLRQAGLRPILVVRERERETQVVDASTNTTVVLQSSRGWLADPPSSIGCLFLQLTERLALTRTTP